MAENRTAAPMDLTALELQVYRILGIPRFRKLVLQYEKLRHRRRGGRNPNYHLQGLSMAQVDAFLPRLRRNVRFHCTSLALLGLFWILVFYRGISCPEAVPLTVFLLWLNLWCLMLQRYHFLRIRLLQKKQTAAKSAE